MNESTGFVNLTVKLLYGTILESDVLVEIYTQNNSAEGMLSERRLAGMNPLFPCHNRTWRLCSYSNASDL